MQIETDPRRRRERGQGLVEYALILALVAVVVVVIAALFGESVQKTYCQVVYTLDPGADIPACESIDVSCNVLSSDPFQMNAVVTDNSGDDDIERVDFYVDGLFLNDEFESLYCLKGGNGPCQSYTNSGTHTFVAIAKDAEGNTGKCEIEVTVP